MKLMRLLQTDLYRAVVHADFWIAALLFGALCFTAEGYWDAGHSITVLELALSYPAEEVSGRLRQGQLQIGQWLVSLSHNFFMLGSSVPGRDWPL